MPSVGVIALASRVVWCWAMVRVLVFSGQFCIGHSLCVNCIIPVVVTTSHSGDENWE